MYAFEPNKFARSIFLLLLDLKNNNFMNLLPNDGRTGLGHYIFGQNIRCL